MRLRAALLVVLLSTSCSGGGGGGDSNPPPPPPPPPGQPVTLSGTVTYDFVPAVYSPQTDTGTLDFAHASPRPVRFARVQVSQGATVLAVETTDAAGHYAITFTPVTTETPVVAALAETLTPSIRVEDNTDGDKVWAVGANVASGVTTIDLRATHGWTGRAYGPNRIAAPFAILDSMYTAEKRILDVRPAAVFPALKANWSPNNVPSQTVDVTVGDIGTSHYSPATNEIYVLGKDGVDTDEFDAHVIVHEWGHFFEDNLSRSDSPGGPHQFGDVEDPRLAFGEGYGNAIAAMLLPESIYADTFWNPGLLAFGFDAETIPTPTDDFSSSSFAGGNPGPFSEMSVLRVLYDLYDDSGNAEGFDHAALGLGPIYDTLVGPERTTDAFTTIASFVAGLKAQPGIAGNATTLANIDAVLAERSIGPIMDQWGAGDPRMTSLYRQVASLPLTNDSVALEGGFAPNMRESIQFWVVTGNGARLTVSAFSASDVGIVAYRNGSVVGVADRFLGGQTETFSFASVNGAKYVIVLVGFESNPASYSATLSVTSP